MKRFNHIRVISFDADDTLWDCQSYFCMVERQYCSLLSAYASADTVSRELFRTETANMPLLGYGCKAFTLSLVETAVRLSDGRIPASDIARIIELGKSLLQIPVIPLPGVCATLDALHAYRLVLFTKGELLDQQNKLRRSGLSPYFEHVEIVSDKTESAYMSLFSRLGVRPEECLMVGNSFKSDIIPALSAGASAIYVPFHVTWQLEQTEEFGHERLERVTCFSDIPALL